MSKMAVRYDEIPTGVVFLERQELDDMRRKDDTDLKEHSKMLMFYHGKHRILFRKCKNANGEIEFFEYHSSSATFDLKRVSAYKRFERGIDAEVHFKDVRFHIASSSCRPCNQDAIVLDKVPKPMTFKKFLMADRCWAQYLSQYPEIINNQKIMWMEFDCYKFDKDKSDFTSNPGNVITDYGRELLIDFYAQYNNLLAPCHKCPLVAKLPFDGHCFFPCKCGTKIIHSCCNEYHAPVPCRIFKRWKLVTQGDTQPDDMLGLLSKGTRCPSCDAIQKKTVTAGIVECKTCRFKYCQVCKKECGSQGQADHDHNGPETELKYENLRFPQVFITTTETYTRISKNFMAFTSEPRDDMKRHKEALRRSNIIADGDEAYEQFLDARIAKIRQLSEVVLNNIVFKFYVVPAEDEKLKDADPSAGMIESIPGMLGKDTSSMTPEQQRTWLEDLLSAINKLELNINGLMQKAAEDFEEGRLHFKV